MFRRPVDKHGGVERQYRYSTDSMRTSSTGTVIDRSGGVSRSRSTPVESTKYNRHCIIHVAFRGSRIHTILKKMEYGPRRLRRCIADSCLQGNSMENRP